MLKEIKLQLMLNSQQGLVRFWYLLVPRDRSGRKYLSLKERKFGINYVKTVITILTLHQTLLDGIGCGTLEA
jgi:hypothetical protein